MSGSEGFRRLVEFILPTGCVACRCWIPPSGPADPPTPIVCDRCRTRLARAPWPRCPRCHAPRGTGRDAAPDCLECREWPPELTRARHAYVLTSPATDLVHALKYEGWRELAGVMGRAMARVELPVDREERRVVVPVPTTARRRKARGYNQARLLAEVVAEALELPLATALRRAVAPASQTALSPEARRENVRGAFSCREPDARRLRGADVLLVDDVLTTGATAGEAARTLSTSGARAVSLITFGRALPRLESDGRGASAA